MNYRFVFIPLFLLNFFQYWKDFFRFVYSFACNKLVSVAISNSQLKKKRFLKKKFFRDVKSYIKT